MGETTPIVRVVGRYVDGLSVSVYGEPRLAVFEELKGEKIALRASPRGLQVLRSPLGVPGGDVMLSSVM